MTHITNTVAAVAAAVDITTFHPILLLAEKIGCFCPFLTTLAITPAFPNQLPGYFIPSLPPNNSSSNGKFCQTLCRST